MPRALVPHHRGGGWMRQVLNSDTKLALLVEAGQFVLA